MHTHTNPSDGDQSSWIVTDYLFYNTQVEQVAIIKWQTLFEVCSSRLATGDRIGSNMKLKEKNRMQRGCLRYSEISGDLQGLVNWLLMTYKVTTDTLF